MAEYEVTLKNGQTFFVTGEPGATDDQVFAKVSQYVIQHDAQTRKGSEVVGGTSPALGGIGDAVNAMGRSVVGADLGLQQLAAKAVSPFKDTSALQASLRSQVDAMNKRDAPLMNSTAGQVGSLLGDSALMLPVGGLAMKGVGMIPKALGALSTKAPPMAAAVARGGQASILGDMARGGAAGAAIGALQPYGENGSPMENIYAGGGIGMLGGGLGNALGRLIQPTGQLTQQQRDLAQFWHDRGIDMSAGQIAGPGTLPAMAEHFLGDNPMGRMMFGNLSQRSGVQNIIGQHGGMTAEEMAQAGNKFASGTMDPAAKRSAAVYQQLENAPSVPISAAFDKQLGDLALRFENPNSVIRKPPSKAAEIAQDIRNARTLDGSQATATMRDLTDAAGDAGHNLSTAEQLNQVRSALNRFAESDMGVPELGQANRQYVVQHTLREPGVVNVQSSDVNMGAFARALKADDTQRWSNNPLPLQEFGERVGQLADTFPQSGTAPRLMLQHLAGGAGAAGMGFLAGGGHADEKGLKDAGAAGVASLVAALLSRRPSGYHLSPVTQEAATLARLLTPSELAIWQAEQRQRDLPTFGAAPPER